MLCMAALFCALAYASTFIMHIKVGFLTFDIKDAVVTIAGLLFGPIYALVISVTVALLEFVSMGETGFWGLLMDVLSTATFSVTCALIYKYKKNLWGAIAGLLASILAMTAVMVLGNIFITPIYMGVARADVVALIPTLLLPFNFIKAVLNGAIVMVLYKPVSTALKAAKVLPATKSGASKERDPKRNLVFSLVLSAIALLIGAICVTVFFVFLGGSFSLVG